MRWAGRGVRVCGVRSQIPHPIHCASSHGPGARLGFLLAPDSVAGRRGSDGANSAVVLQGMLDVHGLPLIALALTVSYAISIGITAVRPGGRAVLDESTRLLARMWNSARSFRWA